MAVYFLPPNANSEADFDWPARGRGRGYYMCIFSRVPAQYIHRMNKTREGRRWCARARAGIESCCFGTPLCVPLSPQASLAQLFVILQCRSPCTGPRATAGRPRPRALFRTRREWTLAVVLEVRVLLSVLGNEYDTDELRPLRFVISSSFFVSSSSPRRASRGPSCALSATDELTAERWTRASANRLFDGFERNRRGPLSVRVQFPIVRVARGSRRARWRT